VKPLSSLFILFLFPLCSCALFAPEKPLEKLVLIPTSFSSLPAWNNDSQSEAIPALRRSCNVITRKSPDASLGVAGNAGDWFPACSALGDKESSNNIAARAFFEKWFRPYEAGSPAGSLFTGYYEAELNGSWQNGGKYQTPLWQRPNDLITANLGDFKPELKGQKITGKVAGQKFEPYDDRSAISKNSISGRAEPLLWVDDPISAFFLEIQGSGRVKLPDGSIVHVGYAAQNGHQFVAIGRLLADMGEVEKPVTMQKIRAWLKAHPDRAVAMMNRNPSVVFFLKSKANGAVGSQGVELTPLRSMAVDTSFIPLGIPLWLDADDVNGKQLRRLVVAQDTGGAIKGAVRGDLFCGAGADAETTAGGLQSRGKYYLLIPKSVNVKP